MRALPGGIRDSMEPRLTGLACPECPGVLEAQPIHPGAALLFRCRIGHTYDQEELLAAKEQRLEMRLWAAVTAFEELAMLLEDLACYPERRGGAIAGAAVIRQLIESDRPVRLEDPVSECPGGPVP